MANKECVIKCNLGSALACGYTKVKIHPNSYSSIILIAGITHKTIQDVTDELLAYAINNTKVMTHDSKLIDINPMEAKEK